VALLTATWTNPADNTAVTNAALDMFTNANAYAAANGKFNRYLYLNYAYKTQKPISGYGSANVQKLERISKKYDPAGIFPEPGLGRVLACVVVEGRGLSGEM
jgi:hypothetical protein